MSIASPAITDPAAYSRAVRVFRERKIVLPTFGEIADPSTAPKSIAESLSSVRPDAPDARNLFRVHWFNAANHAGRAEQPGHVVLPSSITGVDAPIVVLLGDRFPMIGSHKVLAAYACLVPRIVAGEFDPTRHRAVWPSTGNYCRGGVAISRIIGCRGVAVLPEGMSRERFRWLEEWVADPDDIVRTPGSESNVREIYERCADLSLDPRNVVLNQFSEFGNHLVHYLATGHALATVFDDLRSAQPDVNLAAFVSATGSAGTIGAGDFLKERYGTRIVAVEAQECPTLLANGFGEHNIQGIGDKHVPLIHNVMNTDLVVGVSDRATDQLTVLLSSTAGRAYLTDRLAVPASVVDAFAGFGISGICNVVASIKTAKYLNLGPSQAVFTVATDGSRMYRTEARKAARRYFPAGFDAIQATRVYSQHVLGAETDHMLELTAAERQRIFNLGYFTWVEQRGVPLEDFEERARPRFWRDLREMLPAWDSAIATFNEATGNLAT